MGFAVPAPVGAAAAAAVPNGLAVSAADPDSARPLQDAFAEFFITVGSLVPESEAGTYTETFWAALHGLITLERGRRLPSTHRAARIAMLVDSFAAPSSGRTVR